MSQAGRTNLAATGSADWQFVRTANERDVGRANADDRVPCSVHIVRKATSRQTDGEKRGLGLTPFPSYSDFRASPGSEASKINFISRSAVLVFSNFRSFRPPLSKNSRTNTEKRS